MSRNFSHHLAPTNPAVPFGGPPVLKILRVKLQEWLPVGRMEQAPEKNSSHQCQSSLQKYQKNEKVWTMIKYSTFKN